jgi:endonuclease/exonuclease/phosphatase (EEP) superfamily protein YafD
VVSAVFGVGVVGALLALSAPLGFVPEILSQFRAQAAVAFLAVAVAALLVRAWRTAVGAGAFAALFVGLLVPYWTAPRDRVDGPKLTILFANVLGSNENHAALIARIAEERPDVVALVEARHHWTSALSAALPDYPHRLLEPRVDNFGVALFSRRPLAQPMIRAFGPAGTPSATARLELEDGPPIDLVVVHPHPPVGRASRDLRDLALQEMAAAMRGRSRLVVVGDFNATPWSPIFDAPELRALDLHEARPGFGVLPSWPVDAPLLGVPIDQAWASRGLGFADFRLLPSIDSDHRPFVVVIGDRAP